MPPQQTVNGIYITSLQEFQVLLKKSDPRYALISHRLTGIVTVVLVVMLVI